MAKPSVRLIVMALRPEDIVKCTLIANRVKKYMQRYIDISILIAPSTTGVSAITINGEDTVLCDDYEDSVDSVMAMVSRYISRRSLYEPLIAAGFVDEYT